ncbi:MAG: hypothetical protein HC838_07620, partial [Spirulinaceae cyanobacterium RM2_2_10]|nr:hypothetical protein [Spirulinaceae cyanobacterium RM2_2_10]
MGNYLRLGPRQRRFYRRLRQALALEGAKALTELSLEELAAYYRRIEAEL